MGGGVDSGRDCRLRSFGHMYLNILTVWSLFFGPNDHGCPFCTRNTHLAWKFHLRIFCSVCEAYVGATGHHIGRDGAWASSALIFFGCLKILNAWGHHSARNMTMFAEQF